MATLGILVGLQSEAACLSGKPGDGTPDYALRLSAARHDHALRAAEALAQSGVRSLLSFGLAGGLSPTLKPGDLLLPERVMGTRADTAHPVSPHWHQALHTILADLNPRTGAIIGVDQALAGSREKTALFAATGGLAVDMESHIVAAAARRHGLGFAIIRVICDGADATLPPAALVGINEKGVPDLGAILGSVIRHPGQIPSLIRLGRASRIAHHTLLGCGDRLLAAGFGLD